MVGKRFRKINLTTFLNILYIKEKELYPPYISKHNLTCEKQIVFLMIPIRYKKDDGIILQ